MVSNPVHNLQMEPLSDGSGHTSVSVSAAPTPELKRIRGVERGSVNRDSYVRNTYTGWFLSFSPSNIRFFFPTQLVQTWKTSPRLLFDNREPASMERGAASSPGGFGLGERPPLINGPGPATCGLNCTLLRHETVRSFIFSWQCPLGHRGC